MRDNERAEIKRKMEKEMYDCNENIASLSKSAKPISPDNAVGRLSRMGSIADQGVNNAMLEQSKQKLTMLRLALKKIDMPEFGKCQLCGCEIPLGRMMAIPECALCVKCAS